MSPVGEVGSLDCSTTTKPSLCCEIILNIDGFVTSFSGSVFSSSEAEGGFAVVGDVSASVVLATDDGMYTGQCGHVSGFELKNKKMFVSIIVLMVLECCIAVMANF